MILFLEVNGIHMEFTDQEIEDIALSTASGNMKYEDILKFLKSKDNNYEFAIQFMLSGIFWLILCMGVSD